MARFIRIKRRKRERINYYSNKYWRETRKLLLEIPDIEDFYLDFDDDYFYTEFRFRLDGVKYCILIPYYYAWHENSSDIYSGVDFSKDGFVIYPALGCYNPYQLVELIKLIRLRLAKYTSPKYYQKIKNFYEENAPKIRERFCDRTIEEIDVPGRLVALYLTAYNFTVDKYQTQGIALGWLFLRLDANYSDAAIFYYYYPLRILVKR
ncbi:hypothetical protein [uncultured Muribaculum sp.]|uniref:hypothetical protein n=1 Tax=uncultured Muribaculum sp. TaxID=1918613 RepID=UPI002599DC50|nr:hypothetical protein [uncultured Muribaculum sp.]